MTFPVVRITRPASKAAIVEVVGDNAVIATSDLDSIIDVALMMAPVNLDEAFAPHPSESGMIMLTRSHFCLFNSTASETKVSIPQYGINT